MILRVGVNEVGGFYLVSTLVGDVLVFCHGGVKGYSEL